MTRFDNNRRIRDARAEFFRLADLPPDGGYEARFVQFRIGVFSFALPNSSARKRAVLVHDLHHLLTAYDTSWTGEAEIAAWELAGGCASYRAAWLLNILAFPLGLVIAPVRTWRAFKQGRSSANLYHVDWDEKWLDASLGSLRARVIPAVDRRTTARDAALFALYALPGLGAMVAIVLGMTRILA